MLSPQRIVFQGETPYPHEREAIDYIISVLPDSDPYHLWALVDLLDPSTGRLYEIDAIVVGYSAVYLVEIKSGPGVYSGDYQDWYRTPPGESRAIYLENPLRLANHKAKILKSRLLSAMREPRHCPRVEALVFLSHPDVELRFRNHGDIATVDRAGLLPALKEHRFPGSPSNWRGYRLNRPLIKDVADAFKSIGIKARKGQAMAGTYALGAILHEGVGYQDRLARHDKLDFTRRARTYLVPEQTTVERRQQLRRAADRESQLLWDVKDHPHILSIIDSVDVPLGPTVIFEAFENGIPLDAYLRNHPELPFFDRVEIVQQVARTLAYCHRRGIVHGALSPEAVLVRKSDSGGVETRLFNFQLATADRVQSTSHWSALASEPWAVYQAPELRENLAARSVSSDVFSLGALSFLVFTGKAPGDTAVEVDRILAAVRHLDPTSVDESVPSEVATLIQLATAVSPIDRYDDPESWADDLLAVVTAPEIPDVDDTDPLEAGPGMELAQGFTVVKTLGTGATARVLQVQSAKDDRQYALKVALSTEHHERLAQEAETLRELRHPRIVPLIDRLELGGRTCLLIGLAGTETLHQYLAAHGTVSLDHAARYGDDLLSTLEYLQKQQVLHRDIKPANLGIGSLGKEAAHLTLFDFSLSRARVGDLLVGTAVYRDPFLRLRGAWDYAAERWSAAITMHEMLTGVRPSFGDKTAIDPEARLSLAAERFDPSVRDSLIAFFERALAREVDHRFESAQLMRRAWLEAFEDADRVPTDLGEPEADLLKTADLSAIGEDTFVEALPLSPRARNALDRAGLTRAEDLLSLPNNRLSAIRGVGTRVAREILRFREQWQTARKLHPREAAPFFPSYRGEDIMIATSSLPSKAATFLSDAGLTTLGQVANAPKGHLRRLAARHGFAIEDVTAVLDAEQRLASERTHPATLEGWIETLLPPRTKRMRTVRALFGLEADALRGRLDAPVKELSDKLGVTRAAVYIALGKCRESWAQHGALGELRDLVRVCLEALNGAAPLAELAGTLVSRLPHDRTTEPRDVITMAAALVRIVTEIEKRDQGDAVGAIQLVRIKQVTWALTDPALALVLTALGEAADSLAIRPILASPGEVARVLQAVVDNTPLAALPFERSVTLAVAASEEAARSSRLEIYPEGMLAERALELSATMLTSGLTPEALRDRVAVRYPSACPLPDRPELDELVAVYGLKWNEVSGRYERPGEPGARTELHTSYSSISRVTTAPSTAPRAMDPEAIAARQFDERIRNTIERKSFRVLGVTAERAQEAALALVERFGLELVALDERLIAAMRVRMAKGNIREEVIHEADRLGPTGEHWHLLVKLLRETADALLAELLPGAKPTLVAQPGLIARYQLESVIQKLHASASSPDSEAVLLLVPAHDTGGIPTINGEFALPGVLASQSLWIPHAWLANKHNAAA